MPDKIYLRRGNAADLPTLAAGEPGFTLDTKKLYVGASGGNALVAMSTLETVIAPTLLNSWVNFGGGERSAGYYKDNFGIVNLLGTIKSGTALVNTVLFTLPVGYRPTSTERYPVYSNDGASIGTASIDSAGSVNFISGSNSSFCLSGIRFRTT